MSSVIDANSKTVATLPSAELWAVKLSQATRVVAEYLRIRRLTDKLLGTTAVGTREVCILGILYGSSRDEELMSALNKDFASRVWCSYRRGFPLLGDGFSSDAGWGCTLRTGQMLVAEALSRQLLGRGWRRQPNETLPHSLQDMLAMLQDSEGPSAPLSVHSLCAAGRNFGVMPGRWLGPWTLCKSLEIALRSCPKAGLDVCVLCDPGGGAPTLDANRVRQQFYGISLSHDEEETKAPNDEKETKAPNCCQQQGEMTEITGSACPIATELQQQRQNENDFEESLADQHSLSDREPGSRYELSPEGKCHNDGAGKISHSEQVQPGGSCTNPERDCGETDPLYGCAQPCTGSSGKNDGQSPSGGTHPISESSKLLLLIPLTLGMGKVNPLYFPQLKRVLEFPQSVGIVGGRPSASLFFIGHQDDNLLYLDPHETQACSPLPAATLSYFSGPVRLMPISSMDPSIAIGFHCQHRGDFEDLCDRFRLLCIEHSSAPLLTVTSDCTPACLDHYKEMDELCNRVDALSSGSEEEVSLNCRSISQGNDMSGTRTSQESRAVTSPEFAHGCTTRSHRVDKEKHKRKKEDWEVV